MYCRHADRRPPEGEDHGFTLVELLVVLVITGLLAAMAVSALLLSQRKAYETSAKSDLKTIAKEIQTLDPDGAVTLDVTGADGTWTIVQDGTPIATGDLSPYNTVSTASSIDGAGGYCLSVRNARAGAQYWTADDVGLRPGDCAAGP